MTSKTSSVPDRELLFAQDRRLLEAAKHVAQVMQGVTPSPQYPQAPPRALLVGGFVRDALIGLTSKDADIEVFGVAPEHLKTLLEQLYPGQVNHVGSAFDVLKLHVGEDIDLDISIPRRESKSGQGHRDFVIHGDPGMSIEEAARRRDFTINAMSADPLSGEILDPFNGRADLEHRLLRVTDPERFQDDPLRVYRAVQLAARMELEIDPRSMALMREMVARGDLAHLSWERVSQEMKKLFLRAARPSIGLDLMREMGLLERDYPMLNALIGTQQEPEWHPEGDVWVHSLMVVDQAARLGREAKLDERQQLMATVGALVHDLGKPSTTAPGMKDGVERLRSLGHEQAGVEPTKALFKLWFDMGQDIEQAACAIAAEHLKPDMLYRELQNGHLNDVSYANAVRKTLKRIQPMPWQVLLVAAEADSRGRTVPGCDTAPYTSGKRFAEAVRELGLEHALPAPLLLGRDLLELGLQPGKDIGMYLDQVEHARDEGKITTREEALDYIKKRLRI